MSSANAFIKNGLVVDPANNVFAHLNVIIKNGKIEELTQSSIAPRDATMINADGMVVAPGLIDMHVHLREPGQEYKEDIESGSRAAAAGGFTSVACMANTTPVNDNASVLQSMINRSKEVGIINIFPIGAITKGLAGKELADIGDLAAHGAVALSDDGMVIGNAKMLKRAMEYASTFNLPIISHCEDNDLVEGGVMNEGIMSNQLGVVGRPKVAEDINIFRDTELAHYTGCHLHVAHLTSGSGLDIIRLAKAKGTNVTTEVCPHHLFLTEEAVANYNVNAKMNPPLRTESDCRQLIAGLKDGTIDAIATDHAPHAVVDKEVGLDGAMPGIVGLETSLSLCMKLVHDKHLTMTELIRAMTFGPARILHINKGTFNVGADADVTIFDPNEEYSIDSSLFYSKGRNTPFDGRKVKGRVKITMVGGRVVYPFR